MDLTRSVKINKRFEITLGRFLLASLIIIFQMLGILCLNDWQLVPEIFFVLSSFFRNLLSLLWSSVS